MRPAAVTGGAAPDLALRRYHPDDLDALIALFDQTVHTVNAKDYTPRQLDAWADGQADRAAWDRSLRMHISLVAVLHGQIVGFGDIAPDGYLDRLFVHAAHQRQGIGTALCNRLEQAVSGRIVTHASITARPFFAQRGYRTARAQQVERHGVLLTNYQMVLVRP